MLVQDNHVWFEAQADLPHGFGVVGYDNVEILILQEDFPIFSLRRSHVHKQDDGFH
jgi:hypothetical protein